MIQVTTYNNIPVYYSSKLKEREVEEGYDGLFYNVGTKDPGLALLSVQKYKKENDK